VTYMLLLNCALKLVEEIILFCVMFTMFLCCHMQNFRYFHLHYTEHFDNGQDRLKRGRYIER